METMQNSHNLNGFIFRNIFLYPQVRRSLGGILVWVCPSVHLCVTLAPGQEPLEIGSGNLVCRMSMKIKKTHIFFLSIVFVIAALLPFSFFTL